MKSKQAGNAIVIILIAVFLFGALAAFFMKGAKTGAGNMSANQARMAAQELATFFKTVDNAVQKLRSKGCSENDISFANSRDTGGFISSNKPATAPVDGSCDVFLPAGAGLTMNMDWAKYQVSASALSSGQTQIGNIFFRPVSVAIQGVGSSATEYLISFNFLKPEICDAYNSILGLTIDKVTIEPSEVPPALYGDQNLSLAGKQTFCHFKEPNIQNGGPHTQIVYVWSPR